MKTWKPAAMSLREETRERILELEALRWIERHGEALAATGEWTLQDSASGGRLGGIRCALPGPPEVVACPMSAACSPPRPAGAVWLLAEHLELDAEVADLLAMCADGHHGGRVRDTLMAVLLPRDARTDG